MKKLLALCGVLFGLAGCVAVPPYAPPPGYYGNPAYEYYPGYNYYYGAPYPAYYGSFGYYDWDYWGGRRQDHWGRYSGRGGHWGHSR